ncbi:2,3-diaminopropionate biosynthesis protein SbnA [Paenibacillus sp. 481]|uniref:2,3-diaminopropionate biosynthesis protein SbnA n=1 Tax=Paenibacillus sp. 481 TaxID=2835869 RepID=UPI001E47F450|nr:2,3-diaminopropionate biosynthesis protein SbnA [Paenibacillus sp. 481]UHA73687.1 2,3-diaminopropionate biosynthesis protein SbnA [Paenibacillus sp. 481]
MMSVIGHTPIVKLQRIFKDSPFETYVKLEMLNPGGSTKDRPARAMILAALEEGRLRPGSVVVESSSGNLAIGLAQICNLVGCRFICVVDPRTTTTNLRILRAYGARIDLVRKPDAATGEFVPARLRRVRHWLRRLPNAFWPNQYANSHNALSHQQTTMTEIAADLPRIDYLFCGVSTCGTLRGCVDYIREHGLRTKVVAVDAEGSAIFGKQLKQRRLLPGLGAGIRPSLCPTEGIDEQIDISELECIVGCRKLARIESILAGGSSGGVIAAVHKYRERIPAGSVCVLLLPDRGERYLETIYDDAWIAEQYGHSFLARVHAQLEGEGGDEQRCVI